MRAEETGHSSETLVKIMRLHDIVQDFNSFIHRCENQESKVRGYLNVKLCRKSCNLMAVVVVAELLGTVCRSSTWQWGSGLPFRHLAVGALPTHPCIKPA
jgi:hypothetical protein